MNIMNERYRVILIGELGVGKSSILNQFINGNFNPNYRTCISSQFFTKTIYLPENKNVTIDLWDTTEQEKYHSLPTIYYKNANVVILVYDITKKYTFDEAKNYWYEQIKQNHEDNNIIIILVANKNDLYEDQKVSNEEGKEFAKNIGAIFISTSAKNNNDINFLFENIAMKILNPNFDYTSFDRKAMDEFRNNIKKERNENDKTNNKIINLNIPKEKKKNNC